MLRHHYCFYVLTFIQEMVRMGFNGKWFFYEIGLGNVNWVVCKYIIHVFSLNMLTEKSIAENKNSQQRGNIFFRKNSLQSQYCTKERYYLEGFLIVTKIKHQERKKHLAIKRWLGLSDLQAILRRAVRIGSGLCEWWGFLEGLRGNRNHLWL